MGKPLVICETRSLAEDVSRALGGRFISEPTHLEGSDLVLTWMDGPLAGLADPEAYDAAPATWRIEDLPVAPERFEVVARAEGEPAKEQLKAIRALVRRRDVDRLVNACDAGREGELTFAQLRPGGELQSLEDAARSRARRQGHPRPRADADAGGARAAGARDRGVRAGCLRRRRCGVRAGVGQLALSRPLDPGQRGGERGGGRPAAGCAGTDLADQDPHGTPSGAPPVRADGAPARRAAPAWIDRAARGGRGAGVLRAGRVLSYPRSSSRSLPRELADELREIALHVGRAATAYRKPAGLVQAIDELPLERVVDDVKVGDHHAVIPTNAAHALSSLGDDARRIYDMVARRFLAAFLPPVELEYTIVLTRIERQRFYAHGHVVRQAGWYAAYDGLPPGGGTEAGDPPEQELPELREGEEVRCARVERSGRETSPPARFDDVSLLAALRGAADAATIERLIELNYVVRDGRALRPTARGVQVIDLLGEHALTSLGPLRAFEERLLAIERGEESRDACVRDVAVFAGELVGYLRDLPAERTAFPRRDLGIVCPRCGEGTLLENRKGYGCSTWTSREETGSTGRTRA